jgi:CBS domain-containing protein
MKPERVSDAMTPSPISVESSADAVEAARLLAAENVGSLPVVDAGELVGMVTDRDLVLMVLAKDMDPHKVTVADVCTSDPVVATADEALDEALERMASAQVRRLPVVTDGRLVGILAQADVARSAGDAPTGHLVEQISRD